MLKPIAISVLSLCVLSCKTPVPVESSAPSPKNNLALTHLEPANTSICKVQDDFNIPIEKLYEMRREQQELVLNGDAQRDQEYRIKTYDQLYIFKEKDGNQIMILSPCCDQPTGTVFVFITGNVPPFVIDYYMPLLYQEADLEIISDADVKKFIEKRSNYGKEIDESYFKSRNGIKLGMPSSEVIKIYGPPLSKTVIDQNHKITRYTWENYGQDELEGYRGAQVRDGYFYAKTGVQPDKETRLGTFCTDVPQGVTIYIDFQPTVKGDKAIFIYMDHHGIG